MLNIEPFNGNSITEKVQNQFSRILQHLADAPL